MVSSITRDFFFFQSLRFIDFEMAFGRSLLPSPLLSVFLLLSFSQSVTKYTFVILGVNIMTSIIIVVIILMLIKLMMDVMS